MSAVSILALLLAIAALGLAAWTGLQRRSPWFAVLAAMLTVVVLHGASAMLNGPPVRQGFFYVFAEIVLGVGVLGGVLAARQLKRAPGDRALGEGRERILFEYLLDSSPDAIVLLTNEDEVLDVNRAFTEVFGYSADEAVGRTISELIVPPGLLEEGTGLTNRVAAGEEVTAETVRRCKDGTLVDVSIRGAPIRAKDHQLGVYGIYRDVTAERRAAMAVRQLEKAVETMQLGVSITDLDGIVIYANPAEHRAHGWEDGELVGRDVGVFTGASRRQRLSPGRLEAMTSWHRETVNRRRDGTTFPVSLTSDVVRDESGRPVAVVTTSMDITERQRSEAKLRESEERYALAARGANDGLWDWNLSTNQLHLSTRWREMLGYDGEAVSAGPDAWFDLVHSDDLPGLEVSIAAHLQGLSPHLEYEHRLQRRDGSHCWVLCRGMAVRDDQGRVTRMAGSMTDVTERKEAESRLQHDAFYDGLTGLPNRALFTKLLQRSIGRAQRSENRRYAVLFLDLDRFKVINDSLGHAYGDRLLVALARRLEGCLRPGDTVARLGGDEFTILLDDIEDASDATRVADRVEQELQEPFELDEHEAFTSASIGIAFGASAYSTSEEIIRDADLAMYRAKNQGKGRYEVFDQKMHSQAMNLLDLETSLRHAVDRDELVVQYQPIVTLGSSAISGFEALVRWRHPVRGLLAPGDFIPLAEETGLIVQIGEWVLREACRQVREWQMKFPSEPPYSVSVNLSPRQIRQPQFVEGVIAILEEVELDPRSLKLEITENTLMEHADSNVAVVHQLTDAGVQVLIDDFGTGYSSLSYLHRFSVDSLKIDRSFVRKLEEEEESLEIVRSIVTLARALGMTVIAEGVETTGQEQQLKDLKCEEGQGYLFSHAVDNSTIDELLAHGGQNGRVA
jgi:diguanylate cyclase (GGDEF)-like protein/PAS domain S-box-containing protein